MAEPEALEKVPSGRKAKYADNILPLARVRKIMKMDPNICDNITLESNYLVCSAAELFIKHLAKSVYEMDTRCLTYQNLAKFVQDDEKLDFLHDIVPNKIKLGEYKKILAEEKEKSANIDSGSDVSDSSSEDASGEEEEEEDEN